MVIIEERQSNKVPGETSLYIAFKCDFELIQKVISFIKSKCPIYHYDKKSKEWEIPIRGCSEIIDVIIQLDEVQLITLPYELIKQDNELLCNYNIEPYEHQREGIIYGINNDKFLLLDEPGLGKTMQAIYIAEELYRRGKLNHCLIICGVNNLKYNWVEEIHKFSNLSCRILGSRTTKRGKEKIGSISDRVSDLLSPIEEFFIITNIETIRSDTFTEAFNKHINDIDMIIVDEIHCCKSTTTSQGKNLLKLKAEHQIGLTGTPIVNNPLDCFASLKWLEIENCCMTVFKEYYCTFDKSGKIVIGFKNIEELQDELQQHSIRRTKEILKDKLPEKIIIDRVIEMSDAHKDFYDKAEQELISILDNADKTTSDLLDKIDVSNLSQLSTSVRLRQATSTPSSLSTKDVTSSKIEYVEQLLRDELMPTGEKVVIYSTFKEPCERLYEDLKEYKPILCTGDTDDAEFYKMKELFQNDDEHKILIATTTKLKAGVTLNRAKYMIFVDCSWTHAQNLQNEDRIHRIGSKDTVFIYYIWCQDTYDMIVKKNVRKKKIIADYMVDNKLDEQYEDTSELLAELETYLKSKKEK